MGEVSQKTGNDFSAGLIRSFIPWFLFKRGQLKKYKGIHKGGRCFIIGNGPSLNKTDLGLLRGCHVIGLNKIHLILDKVDINFSYHVCVNPLVIEQSRSDFKKLGCPTFISYRASRGIPKEPGFHYLFPFGGLMFGKSILWPISEGFTVTFVAMQLAYYMGFDEVYLVGVDHNFTAAGKPNEKQTLSEDDINHFDKNYFKGKEWHLPDIEGSELAYRMARFYFNRAGRTIYDATVDGKLEVFPKLKFEAAVARCKAL